ncbi:hypothetical protein NQ318_000606 [Aromia moschata]|uniref:CRC domain-containing protein n=1 Tax=Aromia moschata TaxID=1265417 RepID=A0AAV8X2R8_9CUCU|nr:hypothetical protein NQ318_000606 [Aromia moschata]
METDEQEVVVESQEVVEHEEEVETEEITAEEMEVETEQHANSPDEILPDVKATKTTTVPPLRPLTIAPKPTKVPLAVKPVSGQQLLLLQGGGTGQAIKLVSPQGQELNLGNFQLSRSVTLKPTIKTLTSQGGNISIVQQKPVVMKKILAPGQKTVSKPLTTFAKQGQHFMVVQKSDQQQIKIVQAQSGNITIPSPTKTITLQQAQEMGLLSNAKFVPQGQTTTKQTVLLSKNPQKTIKIVPQVAPTQLVTSMATTKTVSLNTIKSPAKILPAASGTINKGPQRIIFKTTGGNQAILPSGQLIQVAGSQTLNTGQLHQINIPGKGMQYIKFVTANTDASSSPSAIGNAKSTSTTTTNIVLSEIKPVSAISKIAPKPLKPSIATNKITVSGAQMVVVPTNYSIPAHQPQVSKVAISPNVRHTPVLKPPASSSDTSSPIAPKDEVDANGMRPRKPCNCTKSQCLKLYCDCFANGEFCYMCNCMNCFNNLDNEDHRNRAIKACLERNPNAFRPKIGKAKDISGDMSIRKHTKGCNCKRSGCLKNYCECYEAKIACSNNCKCIGCRNIEDSMEKKNLRITNIEKVTKTPILPDGKIIVNKEFAQFRPRRTSNTSVLLTLQLVLSELLSPVALKVLLKLPSCHLTLKEPAAAGCGLRRSGLWKSMGAIIDMTGWFRRIRIWHLNKKQTINFITDDVIEATCQCMLTISDNADENMQDEEMTKRLIIEEFGRCLTEIIECSSSRNLS